MLWAIIVFGSAFLAWLVAPIAGYQKARQIFLKKSKTKDNKLPVNVKIAIIVTAILSTALGYLVLAYFLTHSI